MIRTLSKSIREYKKPSLLSPLFVALEVVFECIIPLVMANMIDHMNGSSMTPILQDGFILIVLSMASLFCGRLAAIQAAKGATGFAKNLRKDMFYNIQSLSFADVDKFSTSSLVTRMTTDVTNVQTAYSMIIRALIRAPFMIIFSIVMTISINAKMSLIFLAILPFLAAVLFGIAKYVHPIFVKIFHKYDAMNDTVQEKVSLANRFGVTIGYFKPSPMEFNEIVRVLARKHPEITLSDEELCARARTWEINHGGFSGRCAQQFVDYLAGQRSGER